MRVKEDQTGHEAQIKDLQDQVDAYREEHLETCKVLSKGVEHSDGGWFCYDSTALAEDVMAENQRLLEHTDMTDAANAELITEVKRLRDSLPFSSDRDRNKAREMLGKVYRHATSIYGSIGVVNVNKAMDALVHAYAEGNAVNEENKRLREALEPIRHHNPDTHEQWQRGDWMIFWKAIREVLSAFKGPTL